MSFDLEAEGLLVGCEGHERRERAALLDQLFAEGATLAEVKQAITEDRLAMLPVERVLAGAAKYTASELAHEAQLLVELVLDFRQAIGLARPGPDERVFGDHDLDAARTLSRFLGGGVPAARTMEMARILGRGLAPGADALRGLFGELLPSTGLGEHELAVRNARVVERLLPLMGSMLEHILRLQLLDQVRAEVTTMSEMRATGRVRGTLSVVVCFVDMVGFTSIGERLKLDEIGGLTSRLEKLTSDLLVPPVKLVKMIGDAVMLVAPKPEPLLEFALDLLAAAESQPEVLPPLRVGVASGTALNRSGDWYGKPVNVASRLAGIAPRSAVCCTADVRDLAPDSYPWEPAGVHRLKGIDEDVQLFTIRRAARTTRG